LFRPHPAVGNRQRFCSEALCQKARKAENNRTFAVNNPDYFRGAEAVKRTQEWRKGNPGYWRRPRSTQRPDLSQGALQVEPSTEPPGAEDVPTRYLFRELQAELIAQRSVFQGFAAQLTGCALQAELSNMLGEWHDKGVALGAAEGPSSLTCSLINEGEKDAQLE